MKLDGLSSGVTATAYLLALTSVTFCATNAFATDNCHTTVKVEEIAPGVYVRPGQHAVMFENQAIANIGFVIGSRYVAVIDTGGSQAEGDDLKYAIRQVTALPIRYVINTHAHPDHVLGNAAFKDDRVEFVGHTKLSRALATRGDIYLRRAATQLGKPLSGEFIVFPTLVVKDTRELDLGGRKLLVTAHSSAHTDHDLTVYDDQTGTLWLSDLLFMEHIPALDAGIKGWIDVLQQLSARPAQRVVPGHGPPQAPWPDAATDLFRYLTTLRDQTRRWIADGGDLGSAQGEVGYNEARTWKLFDEYHQRNVGVAFAELEWED